MEQQRIVRERVIENNKNSKLEAALVEQGLLIPRTIDPVEQQHKPPGFII